jgi:hypothetical protein
VLARAANRPCGLSLEVHSCGNAPTLPKLACDHGPMAATLRKDFDEFLMAPVGKDSDGNPITLLTVLARLGVDPWEEAADLSHLSREPAMQRLASRLEAMPNGPASAADTVNIATRLITLLHRTPTQKAASPEASPPQMIAKAAKTISPAVYWLIGVVFILVAQWAIYSGTGPPPMNTTIAPQSR